MELIPGYDDWKTSPPESSPVKACDYCGCELDEGDYIYEVDGESLCRDCLDKTHGRML